ncbi:hypothetical protein [Mesonia aestuariivivens]|uniref:Uncharacterized protein n=1 Tax=Mesonia aestuariivivens TaxID=2796128 RepID=A0ABS6VZ42_9FLAO|nr:hypothetical protein [Mesonia aestuariivivens]MBW2960865.1 hypothetical protein [Mesonia aestuariivivens]
MVKKNTSIDWDNFERTAKNAAEKAAVETDEELTLELAALTRLTQKDIVEIFPEPADVEAFAELMLIVKSASRRNTKINKIVANSEKFAGIIIDLFGKVI